MQENTEPNKVLIKEEPLPDITTSEQSTLHYPIDQVGMSELEMLVNIGNSETSRYTLPAKIDVFVNLENEKRKGIHMSRLYAATYDFFKTTYFTPKKVDELLKELITSQKGISSAAFLNIKFAYMMERPSLLSETRGMRHYPIEMNFEKRIDEPSRFNFKFTLTYSSACPCSTALSEKYIRDQLESKFDPSTPLDKKGFSDWLAQQNILSAIPHSQRSYADITLNFKTIPEAFDIENFILDAETVIQTSVQTSVKREDEQMFAKINADNLMFCEDAVRILKNHYAKNQSFKSFNLRVSHHESLHAHNAVASIMHRA